MLLHPHLVSYQGPQLSPLLYPLVHYLLQRGKKSSKQEGKCKLIHVIYTNILPYTFLKARAMFFTYFLSPLSTSHDGLPTMVSQYFDASVTGWPFIHI